MKKYIEKLEGIFTNKDYISPAYISLKNPKYVEIDGMYYTGIIFVNYNRENTELILKKIVEPANIEGLEIIYEENKLTINNAKDNLKTMYENYPNLMENCLWLNAFIEDYKICKFQNK